MHINIDPKFYIVSSTLDKDALLSLQTLIAFWFLDQSITERCANDLIGENAVSCLIDRGIVSFSDEYRSKMIIYCHSVEGQ